MAVLVEAISVVIRKDSLASKYPGGLDGFRSYVPNQTLCEDNSFARIGLMIPQDVRDYIEHLEACGLTYLSHDEPVDIVVVDQIQGMPIDCD